MKALILVAVSVLTLVSASAQEKFGDTPLTVDSSYTFPNAVIYKDSLGRVYVEMKLLISGETLIADSGTPYEKHGLIPFNALTAEDLEFVIRQIRYFESDNKRKKR